MNSNIRVQQPDRAATVKRGRSLEYFTIGYNSLEGLIAVVAGLVAGSTALVGFGFDSLIEVASGTVLLWRLHADVDEARRERVEAISLRIVGVCFMILAIYVIYDSVKSLIKREAPDESLVGMEIAKLRQVRKLDRGGNVDADGLLSQWLNIS